MENTEFDDPRVADVFASYPDKIKEKMLILRALIFETASQIEGLHQIEETLKWGEPSYLTKKPKIGSTIRINWKESLGEQYAIYFKCTSLLVPSFKLKYPSTFQYDGNRAILFNLNDKIPIKELRDCISMGLTYHRIKKTLKSKLDRQEDNLLQNHRTTNNR